VWSAGIIFLFFLTRKFPLFQSNDDVEAMMELSTIIGRKGMERTATLHSAYDTLLQVFGIYPLPLRSHLLHECSINTRGGDDMVTVCGKAEPEPNGTQEGVTAFLPALQVRRNHLARAAPIFFSVLIPFIFDDRTRQKFLSSTGTVIFADRH
jgi:hypothetical protein